MQTQRFWVPWVAAYMAFFLDQRENGQRIRPHDLVRPVSGGDEADLFATEHEAWEFQKGQIEEQCDVMRQHLDELNRPQIDPGGATLLMAADRLARYRAQKQKELDIMEEVLRLCEAELTRLSGSRLAVPFFVYAPGRPQRH